MRSNRSFTIRWLALGILGWITACSGSKAPVEQSSSPPAQVNPTAAFAAPATAVALQPVAFDASTSTSADGSALQYAWDFGDGQRGGGAKIAHLFSTVGDATVTLTVIDGSGHSATASRTLTVSAAAATGSPVTALVVVKGVDGMAMSGVAVTPADAASAPTDDQGQITVSVSAGSTSTLKFSKEGFADQFLSVSEPQGAGTDGYFLVVMHARDAALTLSDASAGGTLSGRDGASITVPANAFVDAAGNPVTGPVQISITPVDVTQAGAGGFPGSFSGIQTDGTETAIVSLGVEEFIPTVSGAKVQLAAGKSATISIPIYAAKKLDGTVVAVGDSIALWSLDETTGIWIQEGMGQVVASADSPSGLALSAVVSHLSYWNCDLGFPAYDPEPRCFEYYESDPANAVLIPVPCDVDAGTGDGGASSGSSARARAHAKAEVKAAASSAVVAAFSQQYAIPSGGGQSIRVPSDIDVTLTAYALNGAWSGSIVVNGHVGANDQVDIILHPTEQVSAPEAITLPFDDTRSISAAGTARFGFTATGSSVARIELTAVNSAGQMRLMQGTSVLGTQAFTSGQAASLIAYVPGAGTYSIEIDLDQATEFHLQAALEPDDGTTQSIIMPFSGTRSLLPNATADFGFTGTANQYARIVVTGIDNSSAATNSALTGRLVLLQGTTVVGSADIVSGTAQLLIMLPSGGAYTIEVDGTAGASFQLTTDMEGSSVNEVLSIPFEGSRSIAAESTYQGSLTLTSATTVYFDSRHVSGDLTEVRLLAADGTVLFDAPPTGDELEFTNAFISTLPAGTYSVVVTPQNGKLAEETLFLSTTPWTPVAPPLPASGPFQTIDLVFDRNGKPVVGLVAYGVVNNQSAHTLQLRRWTGTAWESVGTDVVTDSTCGITSGASFAFDNSNNPILLYASTSPTDNSTYWTVLRLNNGAWAGVGANNGRLAFGSASADCNRPSSTLIGGDGQPVVAYSSDTGAVVQHFDGSNWVGYVTPAADVFGDYQTKFDVRFDAAGNLWIALGTGAQSNSTGAVKRLNTMTQAWDAIGAALPQIGTIGLEQPRLRFDSAGSPVIAFTADVGSNATSHGGVAVYRFDGTNWSTTGGHDADDSGNNYGGDTPDPTFVMFNDQAVVAWDSLYVDPADNSWSATVVQTNTASGWAPVGASPGWVPQYGHGGLGSAEAHGAKLATDGTDLYMSVGWLEYDFTTFNYSTAHLTLLKKAAH
jgi:hypothetical protein